VNARLGSAPVDPVSAREAARRILGSRRFRSSPTPRPLRKPLSWIGDRVSGILDWFGRVLSHIPSDLLLLLAIAAVVVILVFIVSKVRAQRGAPDGRTRAAHSGGDDREDPAELERMADAAERAGRLDAAVRLRFRAGLLRLGDRGAIRYRPSVTTNEVRRVLGSETFDELARTFDAIAYGGRGAEPPDVDAARREWPRVVSAATRRAQDSVGS
jgi:Domain of unknown function (DUF4129)